MTEHEYFNQWFKTEWPLSKQVTFTKSDIAITAFVAGIAFQKQKNNKKIEALCPNPIHSPECICNTKGLRDCDCCLIKPSKT